MSYAEKAKEIFMSGCNCSQSVFLAFSEMFGIDETLAKKISIGLGGGVGRMREICGAVSGGAMVLGAIYGGEDGMDRGNAYTKIQQFANKYKEQNGSIICREILGISIDKKESPIPEARTEQYYKARPCAGKIYEAAEIIEKILKEDGILKTD